MSVSTDPAHPHTEVNSPKIDRESVRRRPDMYVGDIGEYGLHHLLWELLNNSTEETKFGGCRNIHLDLLTDGGCAIRDDGRGISVDVIDALGRRFLELAFTDVGFTDRQDWPGMWSGLHGLGLLCVNSLSRALLGEPERPGSSTKERLNSPEARAPVARVARDACTTFLRDHPAEPDAILAHLRDSRPADPKTGL